MPDLGTKHECTSCSTKFYDLGKDEPICPKCGLNQLAEEEEEPVVEEEAAEADEPEAAAGEGEGKAAEKKPGDKDEAADEPKK